MLLRYVLTYFILLVSFSALGCGPNEAILKSNANEVIPPETTANVNSAYDSVDSEVENMRTADFDFILVLRRKDGGVMQADDKAFVRNITTNANRRSLSDNEKAIVIGSNSNVPSEMIQRLSERFAVQDYSKPEAENGNSNLPSNANIRR